MHVGESFNIQIKNFKYRRVIQHIYQRFKIYEGNTTTSSKIMHKGESFNTQIKDYACRRVI